MAVTKLELHGGANNLVSCEVDFPYYIKSYSGEVEIEGIWGQLEVLASKYVQVFGEEWGESLQEEDFLEPIKANIDSVILSILTSEYDNSPVGVAVGYHFSKEDGQQFITNTLTKTLGINEREVAIPIGESLPDNMLYWSEVFIDPSHRKGLEPYRSLADSFVRGLNRRFPKANDLVFFTKAHRTVDEANIRKYLASSYIGSYDINKIVYALNNFTSWSSVKRLLEGAYGNLEKQELEYFREVFGNRKIMSVMKTAKNLNMTELTPEAVRNLDRAMYSISIEQMQYFTSQRDKLNLFVSGLLIKLKNRNN